MAIILNVSLNTSTNPWRLDVDDSNGKNEVPRSKDPQLIIWQLVGLAASGTFVADPNRAFAWKGIQPPAGVFGAPVVAGEGTQLLLAVVNPATSHRRRQWIYQLTAVINWQEYQTKYLLVGKQKKGKKRARVQAYAFFTSTNPTIVNK